MEFIKDGILTFNYEKADVTVTESKSPVQKPTATVTSLHATSMGPYDEHKMYCILSVEFIKDGILTFNYDKRDVTVTERKRPVRKPTSTVTSSNAATMDPYDEQHIDEDDFTGKFLRSTTKLVMLCFSRCLCVHRGGVCASVDDGIDNPEYTPPSISPRIDPLSIHPTPRHGQCCGRYSSYWNAFLLCVKYTCNVLILSQFHGLYVMFLDLCDKNQRHQIQLVGSPVPSP